MILQLGTAYLKLEVQVVIKHIRTGANFVVLNMAEIMAQLIRIGGTVGHVKVIASIAIDGIIVIFAIQIIFCITIYTMVTVIA